MKDVGSRALIVILLGFFAGWIVSRNWCWYSEELRCEGIRPRWHSPEANAIVWSIWYLTLGVLWGYHLQNHPNRAAVDAMYPLLLLLTISWQVALFEKHSFVTAKWLATLSLLVILYITYNAYYQGAHFYVMLSLLAHIAVIIWSTIQLWDLSDNAYHARTQNGGSCSNWSEKKKCDPWSSSGWVRPRPRSCGGSSSSSSAKWWD